MKKFIMLIAILSMCFVPAFAKSIEVEALSDFSTDNPPKTFKVKIVETIILENGIIESGSILDGKVVNVKDPKRLKRDATFSYQPVTLTEPDGNVIKIQKNITGKYSKGLDKGKVAKTVALDAGNFVVHGFSTGYTAIEGAVKNEQGNRIKSSATAVYKGSVLSYVEKGNSLKIKEGEHFHINFKIDETDDDNYDI